MVERLHGRPALKIPLAELNALLLHPLPALGDPLDEHVPVVPIEPLHILPAPVLARARILRRFVQHVNRCHDRILVLRDLDLDLLFGSLLFFLTDLGLSLLLAHAAFGRGDTDFCVRLSDSLHNYLLKM